MFQVTQNTINKKVGTILGYVSFKNLNELCRFEQDLAEKIVKEDFDEVMAESILCMVKNLEGKREEIIKEASSRAKAKLAESMAKEAEPETKKMDSKDEDRQEKGS